MEHRCQHHSITWTLPYRLPSTAFKTLHHNASTCVPWLPVCDSSEYLTFFGRISPSCASRNQFQQTLLLTSRMSLPLIHFQWDLRSSFSSILYLHCGFQPSGNWWVNTYIVPYTPQSSLLTTGHLSSHHLPIKNSSALPPIYVPG